MTPTRTARRWTLAPLLLLLAAGAAGAADKIDPAALKRVKAATAYIKVEFDDGTTAEGTGFAARLPGLIVTNAHVVGMLDNDSKRPGKVEVTLNSGEEGSKTMEAKVRHVDGDRDLALLGLPAAEKANFPAPLPVGLSQKLTETQDVFVVGFPLGRKAGANVTVTATTVTSLRNEGRDLHFVQVNGGMHPGNSGGPLVDKDGSVVGIAVGGYADTQLHLAIATERFNSLVNGTVVSKYGVCYRDGDVLRVPVQLTKIDPIGRMKGLAVETWAGKPGPARPGASDKPPEPLADDGPVTLAELKADEKGVWKGELTFPAKPEPGKVTWQRFRIDLGNGRATWYGGTVVPAGRTASPVDRVPAEVKFAPADGGADAVSLTSAGGFRLREGGGEDHAFAVALDGRLKETMVAADGGKGYRRRLEYEAMKMTISVDKTPLDINKKLAPALKDVTALTTEQTLAADGKPLGVLTDFGKSPLASRGALRLVADQTEGAVGALAVPLPGKKLAPLDTWTGTSTYALGVLGWAVPATATVTYKYEGTFARDGRTVAVLSLDGPLAAVPRKPGKGDPKAKAPTVHGAVDGWLEVDAETGAVGSAYQKVRAELDTEADGKSVKAVGDLVIHFRRLPPKK